jgi:hypothetical protein
MNAQILSRSALAVSLGIAMLTGCGGGSGGSISTSPSLPVAAQFSLTFVNSVAYGSTQSSISFDVTDSTQSCIKFPDPFSDARLDYGASVSRTVWLVDCGTSGWFNVTFHALDVPLADTTIKWTVAESGLTENIVTQGGLCIEPVKGVQFKDSVIAKPPSGCSSP